MSALLDTFAWPLALLALLAVPAAVLIAHHEATRRRAAHLMLGGPLAGGPREVVRLAATVLVVGAVALAAIAFARPRWGVQEIPLEQRGIDVIVVLDVSRSMLAQDIQPSRAQASSAAIGELLTHLQGNRVGLVTFAGSAFPRSPLTLDIEAVRTLVQRGQAESALVRPGSDIAGAVDAALILLDVDDRATAQAIVVVTDGEIQQGDVTAIAGVAAKARSAGVRVFGAFAGTDEPVALPASSGGTDLTRAQRTPLVVLSEQSGGLLRDVAQAPGFAIEFRRLQQTRFAEESRRAGVERFQWFAGAALALLVLQSLLPHASSPRAMSRAPRFDWRRRRIRRAARAAGVTSMALAVLLLSGCTSPLGTPVYRAVAEGNRLSAEGRYDEALAAYDRAAALDEKHPAIAYNRGLAMHRLTRYDESYRTIFGAINEATEARLAGQMEYSAGNSAYLLEKMADARDRYIAALRLDPTDVYAKANLELILLQPGQQGGQPPDDQAPQDPGTGPQGQPTPQGGPQQQPVQPGQSGKPGPQLGQPNDDPSQGPAQPGQPGDALPSAPDDVAALTPAQAQEALEAALGALGPEVTRAQALRILELARQANALDRPAPLRPDGGPPPPR